MEIRDFSLSLAFCLAVAVCGLFGLFYAPLLKLCAGLAFFGGIFTFVDLRSKQKQTGPYIDSLEQEVHDMSYQIKILESNVRSLEFYKEAAKDTLDQRDEIARLTSLCDKLSRENDRLTGIKRN